MDNARYFEQHGAAKILVGDDADSSHLQEALEKLLDASTRQEFSSACSKLCGQERAAEKIANIILDGEYA